MNCLSKISRNAEPESIYYRTNSQIVHSDIPEKAGVVEKSIYRIKKFMKRSKLAECESHKMEMLNNNSNTRNKPANKMNICTILHRLRQFCKRTKLPIPESNVQ